MPPKRSLRSSFSAASTPQKRPFPHPSSKSKRTKATPAEIKSKHFTNKPANHSDKEKQHDESSENEPSDNSPSPSPSAFDESSGYEDQDASAAPSPSSPSDDGYASDDSPAPAASRKKQKVRPKAGSAKAAPTTGSSGQMKASPGEKGKELWRPGVSAGLGPGTQVVIAKPKARAEGKVKYGDDTIHPNTMVFLSELRENNDREWLKMHDPDYRTSLKDFNSFVESLQRKIIEIDETIPDLPLKDITFRIYRDVRFSPDQTPYKTHFSAAWSRTGRKGPFAAYYVQIKPGGSFVGGGLWMPEAQALVALRKDIDREPHKIKGLLLDAGLSRDFLGSVGKDEEAAVKAFCNQNAENALKTKPKGFDADHENVDLLRLRNYTMGRKLDDDEVLGPRGIDRVAKCLRSLLPFITYLNSVVMPDERDDASEDSEDQNGGNTA